MANVIQQVDPFYMALLRSKQRRFQESVDICTDILDQNPYDQVRYINYYLVHYIYFSCNIFQLFRLYGSLNAVL